MTVAIEELPSGATRIALGGRLDIAGTQEIEPAFGAMLVTRQAVIVDLASVNLITSTGVRLLFHGASMVTNRGGKFVLLRPDSNVERVLRVSGVDVLIPIFHDLEAAIAALSDAVTTP